IVTGLSESSVKVRLPAVRCLHRLFRSVLQNAPDEILVAASSMVYNLLEFSPRKESIIKSGVVKLLCGLTQMSRIWALMNMAFQAEEKIKADMLQSLSTEQLFWLLSDSDLNVLMKTLGLLRNLLLTCTHGKQIMQAVILILEGEHNSKILCILANIKDETTAKECIMTNDDILQKIKYYMDHSHVKLQLPAMFCISNLIRNEQEGSQEYMGIIDILHKPNLCDKAKMALQQYLA
uniref:Armadillo repeat-containing protein 8 n=1 Tax=Pan troglodytes TaxID=9598 RepID=A0A2I3S7S6_PANTR